MKDRAEIIKLELSLLPTDGRVLERALLLLSERGFEAAKAYLEGIKIKQYDQIRRGERVPEERA